VAYDDGEKKWYDMKTKTFSVVGAKEKVTYKPRRTTHTTTVAEEPPKATTTYAGYSNNAQSYGAGYGSYGYGSAWQRPWTPYVSLTAHARTEVTFHVVVDPKACQPGDRLVLVGNLEVRPVHRVSFCILQCTNYK